MQKAGYSEHWKAKNIYDLAGNIGEWIMEGYSTNCRVIAGGAYLDVSNLYPASSREDYYPTSNDESLGFRVSLYII